MKQTLLLVKPIPVIPIKYFPKVFSIVITIDNTVSFKNLKSL